MGASEELEYLKSLVSQLNGKIAALEKKAKSTPPPKSPARQLRTVFIGPPGAGTSFWLGNASNFYNTENRKGDAGTKVARRILLMPLGNRRYATRAGRQ